MTHFPRSSDMVPDNPPATRAITRTRAAEPTTEAGQKLDMAWPGTHIDRLSWRERILAIEAVARRDLEQRLVRRIEALKLDEDIKPFDYDAESHQEAFNQGIDAALALLAPHDATATPGEET